MFISILSRFTRLADYLRDLVPAKEAWLLSHAITGLSLTYSSKFDIYKQQQKQTECSDNILTVSVIDYSGDWAYS